MNANGAGWSVIAVRDSQVQNNALKLQVRRPEIEQEAQVSSGRPEVIDALRAMRAVERAYGFQFDEDGVFDQEIDEIFADQDAFVCDRASTLLRDSKASGAQLYCQGVFVDLFQETAAECIRHSEGAADDPVRYRVKL
jgi:hypothetical protein